MPIISRQSLRRLEAYFIAPHIYQRPDVSDRQAKLATIVSTNIIPRLLRLHSEIITDAPPVKVLVEALAPSKADVSGFDDVLLGADLEAAAAYVTILCDWGLPMETLFVELLEPTARLLGEMWNRDECDFIDVRLGVARLQKLLAVFNNTHTVASLDDRHQVLMAMTSGGQHQFGRQIVERFLLGGGRQVKTVMSGTIDDIVDAARAEWFAVANLTAGSDRQIDALTSTIAELRRQSKNQKIGVMVGGPVFTANPELSSKVGADVTAPNAPAAVLIAQKLSDRQPQ